MDQLVNRLEKAFGICRCMDTPGYLHRKNNDDSVMKVFMTYPVLFFSDYRNKCLNKIAVEKYDANDATPSLFFKVSNTLKG